MKNLLILVTALAAGYFGYRKYTESKLEASLARVLCESEILDASSRAAEQKRATASAPQNDGEKITQALGMLVDAAQGADETKKVADEYFATHPVQKEAVRSVVALSKERRGKVTGKGTLQAQIACPAKFKDNMVTVSAVLVMFRSVSQ